jgi:ankyrin repeat protein
MNSGDSKQNARPLVGILLLIGVAGWLIGAQAQRQRRDYALLKALQETRELHLPDKIELDDNRTRAVTQKITRLLNEGADPNLCTRESAWRYLLYRFLPWPYRDYKDDVPGIPALHLLLVRPYITQNTTNGMVTYFVRDDALVRRLMETILTKGGDIQSRNQNSGATLLMTAAANNYLETVELLLNRGADINAPDSSGHTALMEAATRPRSWRLLLKRGANVHLTDRDGLTALYHAAWAGDVDMVRALLAHKADVNARSPSLWTPLHYVAARDPRVIKTLLQAGAEVNARDNAGETPLFNALYGDIARVRILLNAGADLQAQNHEGDTPLLRAALMDEVPAVKLLLERGASVNAKNNDGRTALSIASGRGNPKMIALLKKAGAK